MGVIKNRTTAHGKNKKKKTKKKKRDGDKTESFDDFDFFSKYFHLLLENFFLSLCAWVWGGGYVLIDVFLMGLHHLSGLKNSPCKLAQSIFGKTL